MRTVLVDTDVVSYLLKRDTRMMLYVPHLAQASIGIISFMTVAELERWAISRHWGAKRHQEMLAALGATFTTVESSPALCRKWAEVIEQIKGAGRVIRMNDAWIAATALLYSVPLISHNKKDFEHVPGLNLITEAP